MTEYNLTSQALNIDVLKFHSKKITVVISDKCGFLVVGNQVEFQVACLICKNDIQI